MVSDANKIKPNMGYVAFTRPHTVLAHLAMFWYPLHLY
ncbi:hypothetical protein JCM19232_4432 [Vibrio ishigakensis]|uniref:Uncharacterized protein n=1 Tax=Vibrio ishigakensis TaxID=1481914 RepID=A0A0B8PCZ1_9VIBR|nr:hypothetical protein JCM19232_4432 [Vibrio ishigakensis]